MENNHEVNERNWRKYIACRDSGIKFEDLTEINRRSSDSEENRQIFAAKFICLNQCISFYYCQELALTNSVLGVAGGTTGAERRMIRNRTLQAPDSNLIPRPR